MDKKFYIGICICFLTLLTAITVQAGTVTNLNNFGAGSLRQEIIDAGAGDTIVFAAGMRGTIHLNFPLHIDKNLNISGPGANVIFVSGELVTGVFDIAAGNVQISGLRIANGVSSGAGGGAEVNARTATFR